MRAANRTRRSQAIELALRSNLTHEQAAKAVSPRASLVEVYRICRDYCPDLRFQRQRLAFRYKMAGIARANHTVKT